MNRRCRRIRKNSDVHLNRHTSSYGFGTITPLLCPAHFAGRLHGPPSLKTWIAALRQFLPPSRRKTAGRDFTKRDFVGLPLDGWKIPNDRPIFRLQHSRCAHNWTIEHQSRSNFGSCIRTHIRANSEWYRGKHHTISAWRYGRLPTTRRWRSQVSVPSDLFQPVPDRSGTGL